MGSRTAQSVTELLAFASSQVVPAPGRQPWQYGWSVEAYRRSARAALPGPEGPVTLTTEGLSAWEDAGARLLREKQIQVRWDAEEFWGILGSLTVEGSQADDRTSFVEHSLERLRTIGPALTIQLIANVTWGRSPLLFEDIVVGDAGAEFLDFVNASADSRASVSDEIRASWLEEQIQPRLTEDGIRPVAIACWSQGQMSLASRQAERQLRNLVDLTVMLERDLKAHKVYHRGDTNRPGLRGLTLDRGAVERSLTDAARLELASFPLSINSRNQRQQSVRWFNAEPLPLGELLSQEYLRDSVRSCFRQDPISNRIRVAARWFAEAHYSLARDDTALALGVAMDALLSGKRAMPGSAMADRFALLAEDPQQRRGLVTAYLEFHSVRSSVAHGGHSRKLHQNTLLEQYRDSVHWTAWRSLSLRDKFTPATEDEVDALFDDLRWGARAWS